MSLSEKVYSGKHMGGLGHDKATTTVQFRVQVPGSAGSGAQCEDGEPDRQRVRGAPDPGWGVEEAIAGRRAECLCPEGEPAGTRDGQNGDRLVRADRPAEDGAGVAEKKSCRHPWRSDAP